MKRIFAVLFSLCIMAGAVFSKGYDGDVQFHLGAGFDSYILNTTSRTNDSSFIETAPVICFDFDVESWHLFNLNDTVGLGFMAGLDFGAGGGQRKNCQSDYDYCDCTDRLRIVCYAGI